MTEEQAAREKLVEKVRKLRAKAYGSGTSEAERTTFLTKLARMMADHQIEESELVEQEGFRWSEQDIQIPPMMAKTTEFNIMVEALARLCNCRTVWGDDFVTAIGVKDAVMVFYETGTFILGQCLDLLPQDVTPSQQLQFFRAILVGVSDQIEEILKNVKSDSTALVAVELDNYIAENFEAMEIETALPNNLAVQIGMELGRNIKVRRDVKDTDI